MSRQELRVARCRPLTGALAAPADIPGDKSITQRAIILGALAEGVTEIVRPSTGEDSRSTARAMGRLGAQVTWGENRILIEGVGARGFHSPAGPLDFGNSGTGLRLGAGAMAAHPIEAMLDGDDSLRRRPMDRIMEPLRLMGASVDGRDGRYPPLTLQGGNLSGIDYRSPVPSAQVKSCVLLAGLGAWGITRLTEPAPSRDHTELMLPRFGGKVVVSGMTIVLEGPQALRANLVDVPGDPSAAAFWVVAALIVPGSELVIGGIGLNPRRIGFLDILRRMGGDVSWHPANPDDPEPNGTIVARHSPLKGTAIGGAEVPDAIDELPILAVAAACAEGETVIGDAAELRVKESDRIAGIAAGLAAFGVPVMERPDGLVIGGGGARGGGRVDSMGDHRLAMSMAILGLTAPGETLIRDTAGIATSYPGFERTLGNLTRA